MRLIATKKITYAKKVLNPGDSFVASAEDARLLKGWGKARDYQTAALKAEEPEDSEEEIKTTVYKGRGRYRRTDMRPED